MSRSINEAVIRRLYEGERLNIVSINSLRCYPRHIRKKKGAHINDNVGILYGISWKKEIFNEFLINEVS